jgi:thiol-disulfide isomerase/thioredoxin
MTKKILISLAVVAAIISGVLYGKGLMAVHQPVPPPAGLTAQKDPKTAPAVSFTDAAGARHALSDLRGQFVLLNLWATWCAPCVSELPALASLKSQVPGLKVLAVNVWAKDKPADITAFLKGHKAAALGTLTDSDVALERAFGAYGLPLTVLIDPAGKVVGRAEGPAEWGSPQAVAYFKNMVGG